MKYYIIILFTAVVMLTAGLTSTLLGSAPKLVAPNTKLSPIVRLHNTKGDFFCSGVVIAPTIIATAAHCVVDAVIPFVGPIFISAISVRAQDGKDIGVKATVRGANPRADQAVIVGNFSMFNYLRIVTDTEEDLYSLMNNDIKLVSCGYPWGNKLYCTEVKNREFYNFFIKATGILFPGMSGGPVINAQTGEVVGLNTAVENDSVILAPSMSIDINTMKHK